MNCVTVLFEHVFLPGIVGCTAKYVWRNVIDILISAQMVSQNSKNHYFGTILKKIKRILVIWSDLFAILQLKVRKSDFHCCMDAFVSLCDSTFTFRQTRVCAIQVVLGSLTSGASRNGLLTNIMMMKHTKIIYVVVTLLLP